VEDDYFIACDRPRREIRKPTRYLDSEELIVYTFTFAEEIPKGAELSNYTETISYPSSSN